MLIKLIILSYLTINICYFFRIYIFGILKTISRKTIFVENYYQKINSFLVVNLFIFLVFFIFRILRIILNKNSMLDLKPYQNLFHFWFFNHFVVSIIILLNLVVFFFLLKKLLYTLVKFHFLRLKYFYFYRIKGYHILFEKLIFLNVRLYRLLGESKVLYGIVSYFIRYGFTIVIIYFFVKGLIFGDKVIYIGLLPYYGLYKLIYSILEYLKIFVTDFDEGILQSYYPHYFGITVLGRKKLKAYVESLILGKSKFYFKPNLLFNLDYVNIFPYYNWVFFNSGSMMHSINIYKIVLKEKPGYYCQPKK